MRNAGRYALLSVVGLSCLVFALASGPTCAEFQLELSSYKTQYLPHEPLYVKVAVRNVGPSDSRILTILDPEVGFMKFEIAAPGEEPHKYDPGVAIEIVKPEEGAALTLGPGESYSARADLTEELCREEAGRKTVLSKPGMYVIRAVYELPADMPTGPIALWSNDLTVVVTKAKGDDLKVSNLLGKLEDKWGYSKEQLACYEELVTKYPKSKYALYARYHLAGKHSWDGMDAYRGEQRGFESLKKAAEMFASISRDAGNTPIGLKAADRSGSWFGSIGNIKESQRMFEKAFSHPAATDDDRIEAVSHLNLLEGGHWQWQSEFVPEKRRTELHLPLRWFAKPFGFSVEYNSAANTATASGPRFKCSFRPGDSRIIINGKERTGCKTWLDKGEVRISIPVIHALLAEHYQTTRFDWLVRSD